MMFIYLFIFLEGVIVENHIIAFEHIFQSNFDMVDMWEMQPFRMRASESEPVWNLCVLGNQELRKVKALLSEWAQQWTIAEQKKDKWLWHNALWFEHF